MNDPEYVFDQTQIGKVLWPLAQHGYVIVDRGVLTLLGTRRQLIDSAPLSDIKASMMRFTRGQVLSVLMNGTKYTVSPSWGNHVGGLVMPGSTGDVKSAAGLLLRILEQGMGAGTYAPE